MFSYDYVRNRIEPTSFVEFFGNSIRYWFRIWGFYFRRWLSTTLKQEPQPYYIYHYVHTNEEYGRIGEEFVLYDIPNRRNLVYVLGKLNIEKHWDSWVRNPLYDNQNKQHANDWFSALFRQFRRFAPILEPSLHGARGLTSFIHHTSDALRTLCSQMGTTYLIQLRPRDHWVRAAHTNFELIESRARHCSSRSVLRDAFQADELGLRISSSPPPWSCHNRKQLRSGLMGPWAISKIEVSLEYCGQSPR